MDLRRNGKKRKIRFLLLFFLLFFLYLLTDVILPVKHFSVSDATRVDFDKPALKSYTLSYDIYTSKSGLSTTGEKELISSMQRNGVDIAIINDCGFLASRLEGVYGDKVIISKCYISSGIVNFQGIFFSIYPLRKEGECPEIYNLTRSVHLSFSSFPSLFKFFIFQPFNREIAYENLLDFTEFDIDLDRFQKNPCFISGIGHYSRLKLIGEKGKISLLDIDNTISLVRNKIYITEDLVSDVEKNKEIIFSALKNGNVVSIFSDDFDGDIFVKERDKILPVGSLVKLENRPEILVKVKKGNILTAVYKNGKLKSVYRTDSFVLKPDKEGFYSFIVYRYSMKMPFGFYLGVRPVAFLGNVYVQ